MWEETEGGEKNGGKRKRKAQKGRGKEMSEGKGCDVKNIKKNGRESFG